MIKDVKKRALWRDSIFGKTYIWAADNFAVLVMAAILIVMGLYHE